MRAVYYCRVLFISLEFLLVVFSLFLFFLFEKTIDSFVLGHRFNADALEWVMLYPAMVAGFIFKEGAEILFPDESKNLVLHQWSGYWRLRAHVNVGTFYAVVFFVLCFLVWLLDQVLTPVGAYVFFICSLGVSISAFSFHSAKLKIKELLLHLEIK